VLKNDFQPSTTAAISNGCFTNSEYAWYASSVAISCFGYKLQAQLHLPDGAAVKSVHCHTLDNSTSGTVTTALLHTTVDPQVNTACGSGTSTYAGSNSNNSVSFTSTCQSDLVSNNTAASGGVIYWLNVSMSTAASSGVASCSVQYDEPIE
jgi:hypothetical protein